MPTALASTALHYTLRHCALGHVLVAATPQGVAAVLLGDDEAGLVRDLAQRYSHITRQASGAHLKDWSDAVLQVLAGDVEAAEHVPLDLSSGTALQQRVWAALMHIDVGYTLTYAHLAQVVGKPKAVRAIANACGANPVAVLVPCHRVVRSDGGLGGYRWGLVRKAQLLAQEAAMLQAQKNRVLA